MRKAFTLIELVIVLCIVMILAALSWAGCRHIMAEPKAKVIVAKDTADMDQSAVNGRYYTEKKWYLIAGDGTYASVNVGEFHTTDVGESYKTKWWYK